MKNILVLNRVILLSVLVALTAGCRFMNDRGPCDDDRALALRDKSQSLPNVFVSPFYEQARPRRVVIVAPPSRAHSFHEQQKFALAFADQLRQHGIADATIAPNRNCDLLAARNGRFDERQLVELHSSFNADAVIYCDVSSFSAYAPMQASVSITMVDCREAVVLLSLDGVWDLRDLSTRTSFKQFANSHTQESQLARNVLYQSPSEFLSYAAAELARIMGQF